MFCVFYLHAMYQSLCSVTVTIMVRVSYFYVLHQVLLGFVSSQLLFCFVSVTFLFRVSYFYASCQLLLLVASRLFYLSCDHLLIVCWLHFIQLSVTSMLWISHFSHSTFSYLQNFSHLLFTFLMFRSASYSLFFFVSVTFLLHVGYFYCLLVRVLFFSFACRSENPDACVYMVCFALGLHQHEKCPNIFESCSRCKNTKSLVSPCV